MGQYAMLIIGAIIVAAGIFLKDKPVDNIAQERVIALGTYVGWVLFCVPISRLASPVFAGMPGNWPNSGVFIIQVIMFIIGAELFMKKPFDPHAGDKYKKRATNNKPGKKKGKKSTVDTCEQEQPKKKGGFKKLN